MCIFCKKKLAFYAKTALSEKVVGKQKKLPSAKILWFL